MNSQKTQNQPAPVESVKQKPLQRTCSKCSETKNFTKEYFPVDRTRPFGLQTLCRPCKAHRITKKLKNPPKQYTIPETKRCYKCGNEHPCTKDYFQKDRHNITSFHNWCKTCTSEESRKDRISAKIRGVKKPRTPLSKAHKAVSKGLWIMFKDLDKNKSGLKTNEITGVSSEGLLKHFNSGQYTWDDYMTNSEKKVLFHIDHIIPKSYYKDKITFDKSGTLTAEGLIALKKCWNYKNLRIIPATENIYKSDLLDKELITKHNIKHLL